MNLLDLEQSVPIANLNENSKPIVYFDLETGGLSKTTYILQIAATFGNYTFSCNIKPTNA